MGDFVTSVGDPKQLYQQARAQLETTVLLAPGERRSVNFVLAYVDALEAALVILRERLANEPHAEQVIRILAAAAQAEDGVLTIPRDAYDALPKKLNLNVDERDEGFVVAIMPPQPQDKPH